MIHRRQRLQAYPGVRVCGSSSFLVANFGTDALRSIKLSMHIIFDLIRLVALIGLLACGGTALQATEMPEYSSFLYDIFAAAHPCAELRQQFASLSLHRTVILSVDQGTEFVLDRPDGSRELTCVLDFLHSHGHSVKAMTLQDTVFLSNQREAVRRVEALSRFAASNPDMISSVVLDVEPDTHPRWDCGDYNMRSSILDEFRGLLRAVKGVSSLYVDAVVPWWFAVQTMFPSVRIAALQGLIDGIYLMVYGEPGGPVVNGTAASVLNRLPPTILTSLRDPVYLAIATYELKSPATEVQEAERLLSAYGSQPAFGGISVFRAGGEYDAPRQVLLVGTVVDAFGQPLIGAQVAFGRVRVPSNECGHFLLRAPAGSRGSLMVRAQKTERQLAPKLNPAGQITDVGEISLKVH